MPTPQASISSGFGDLTGKAAIVISGYSGIGVEKGAEKYGSAGLLLSSADRGWSGLSAELRNHCKGVRPWRN